MSTIRKIQKVIFYLKLSFAAVIAIAMILYGFALIIAGSFGIMIWPYN